MRLRSIWLACKGAAPCSLFCLNPFGQAKKQCIFHSLFCLKKHHICRRMHHLFQWQAQTFWLHTCRVFYWEETQTLVASDLHLGKSGHFRKSGIAVPQEIMKQDLMRLFDCLQFFSPRRLLVVGDLFHSHANKEMEWFARWRNDLPQVEFILVRGNHDVLNDDWYRQQGLQLHETWRHGSLVFVHEPPENPIPELAYVCGHLHPGIRISGAGRQNLRLPCFHFSETKCQLPAFGVFTGLHIIQPKRSDTVFAITPHQIIPVQ